MFYIYVIKSITHQTRYVGSCQDINARLKEHNHGKCRYTSGRRPWYLIYCEEFKTRSEAIKRERFLKTGQGRSLLDQITKEK